MTIEMRVLSAEQLLKGNDIKGIANASNWENAYPVTLAGIIEEALNNHPEILWLMPDGEQEVHHPVIDNQVNLCDSCRFVFPECPAEAKDMIYGNGTGNDNICACKNYCPRYVDFLNGGTVYVAKVSSDPEQKVQEYETGAISAEAIRKDVLRGPIENMNLNQPADIAAEEFARGLKEGLEAVDVDSRQVEEEPDQGEEETENQEEPSILENFTAVNVFSEDVKAGSEEPEKEGDSPKAHSRGKAYGKWAEYMGRALSTAEQNLVIKGMTEEHYSLSQIASVVRLSQPTICNRKKRMKEEGELS